MKVIVCGSRHITPHLWAKRVEEELRKLGATEVVSGCAKGGDQAGEMAALNLGIPVAAFPPNWNQYGHAAGPLRNRLMAKYADACIALPGGVGTLDMVMQAKQRGLRIVDLS